MEVVGTKERSGMAKAQKTMMVPEDLYRLIAEQESRTGATFTRQAIAAFMQYFFSTPDGPDPIWMRAVIAVENLELKIEDVPGWVVGQRAAHAITACSQARQDEAPKNVIDPLMRKIGDITREERRWMNVRLMGESTIDAMIRLWALMDRGLDADTMLMAADVEKFRLYPIERFKPGDEALILDKNQMPTETDG